MNSNLLNDRIGHLKDWEQTESLNEILFNTFVSLNDYTKRRFDDLTQEIRDEAVVGNELPVIKTAVCTEGDADSHLFLHPVATEPPLNSSGYLTTVFAECDYNTIQELIGRTYTAEIRGKAGTRQTQVSLRYSLKYLQKLESLYYIFSENGLPWATVNGIYFYKFLDVFCEESAEAELGGIESLDIDFLQYEKYISYDKMMLWNISSLIAPVSACEPKPAYNTILFEHTLKNLQMDEYVYIVCPLGDGFTCFKREQTMYVRTCSKQLEQINLLRISDYEDTESLPYLPLKTNRKKVGLVNALAKGLYIPTRGEAERIVHSLSEEVNLSLMDIKVLPCTEENLRRYKGIDYNCFVETNAFLSDKKLLLFSFKTGESHIWAQEAMFFALSELQLYFYEHRCVGEII